LLKKKKHFNQRSVAIGSQHDRQCLLIVSVSIHRWLEENRGILLNKKLYRIWGLKGMCQNKMKRNHTDNLFSFCSDIFPLKLIFYAAFYWRIYLCFLHFNSLQQQIFWHSPLKPSYLVLPIVKEYLLGSPSKWWWGNQFLTNRSLPLVESEPMHRW
jgi:hypothetical protein